MNNVVGKMLIVMQLVFSILFMCFAGAVYTFQAQWRNKAMTFEKDLAVARQQVDDAIQTRDTEVKEKQVQIDALAASEANLKAEQKANAEEVESTRKLLEAAQLERDKALSDAEVATSEAKARVAEAAVLNLEVQSQRDRIAELVSDQRSLQNKTLSLNGQLAGAREQNDENLTTIAGLTDLIRANGIDARTASVGNTPAAQVKVDGFVESTIKTNAQNQELLKITIGSDDKIYENMSLTVFRGNKYICQARVVKVGPDTAVCLVDEDTRQGTIQRGDNVTTKL